MNQKIKSIISLFCMLILLFVIIPLVSASNLDDRAELEAFLDGIFSIQQKQYKVPGITVAVIKDGEVSFSKGYGYSDLNEKILIDPATSLHRPGSNSKILVWTAVMHLVEQGILDLHVDINTYLDFPLPNKLATGRQTGAITLHNLLTHTSGFEDKVSEIFVATPDAIQPLKQYVRDHLPARVFVPGTTLAYSNYGTTLAAYIIELVTGQPFHEYVEREILEPLEMNLSTFAQPLPEDYMAQMSKGYVYINDEYRPVEFEYVQSYPAGGLSSTTLDMAKLIIAHLNLGAVFDKKTDEENSIEEENLAELLASDIKQENENEQLNGFGENLVAEELEVEVESSNVVHRILQEGTAKLMQTRQFSGHHEIQGMTYGFIEADYNGYRVLSHGGDTFVFHTGLYFLPEEQVGLYVTYNSANSGPARFEFFKSFMDRYFPEQKLAESSPKPIAVGTESNYSGAYHFARSNFTHHEALVHALQKVRIDFDEDGYLLLHIGSNATRFGEISPGVFRELNGQAKIAFSFQDGKANKIDLSLAGPNTLLRTPWYRNINFIASIMVGSLLIMLFTLIRWIKQLFRAPRNRDRFAASQIIATIFIVIFVTSLVLIVDVITNTHPDLGIPMEILQPTSTLSAVFILSKVLLVLAILMLIVTIYLWVVRNDRLGPRILYTLISLCSVSVVWVLWLFNLI